MKSSTCLQKKKGPGLKISSIMSDEGPSVIWWEASGKEAGRNQAWGTEQLTGFEALKCREVWFIYQPLMSLVLRYWQTPHLLITFNAGSAMLDRLVLVVLKGYCSSVRSPGSWHSLICLPNGIAKCWMDVCIDLKVWFSPCDTQNFLP